MRTGDGSVADADYGVATLTLVVIGGKDSHLQETYSNYHQRFHFRRSVSNLK